MWFLFYLMCCVGLCVMMELRREWEWSIFNLRFFTLFILGKVIFCIGSRENHLFIVIIRKKKKIDLTRI